MQYVQLLKWKETPPFSLVSFPIMSHAVHTRREERTPALIQIYDDCYHCKWDFLDLFFSRVMQAVGRTFQTHWDDEGGNDVTFPRLPWLTTFRFSCLLVWTVCSVIPRFPRVPTHRPNCQITWERSEICANTFYKLTMQCKALWACTVDLLFSQYVSMELSQTKCNASYNSKCLSGWGVPS